MRFSRCLHRQLRHFSQHLHRGETVEPDLTLWGSFFSPTEQRILLRAALHELDSKESRRFRMKRVAYSKGTVTEDATGDLRNVFCPDEYYNFEEGHYDGVIKNYREMHLAEWPTFAFPTLSPILKRLYALCPTPDTQTHLLHLASDGEILPHIDNVDASGSWILGVSLGAQRVLRMDSPDLTKYGNAEIPLPSGSVYLQKDSMRYTHKHSILAGGTSPDSHVGQRLSIMIRDRPKVQHA